MPPKKKDPRVSSYGGFEDEEFVNVNDLKNDADGDNESFNTNVLKVKDGVQATWVSSIVDSTIYTEVGDTEVNFDPKNMKLSEPQREHMERLIRIFSYSNTAIDTSSTGAGKSYVALGLFKELNFDTIRVLCPDALVDTWEGHFVRSGLGKFDSKGNYVPNQISYKYKDNLYLERSERGRKYYELVTVDLRRKTAIANVLTYPYLMNEIYKNVGNGKKPLGFNRKVQTYGGTYNDIAADVFFDSPIYELPEGSERADDEGLDPKMKYYRTPEMRYHFDIVEVEGRNVTLNARDVVYYDSVSDVMKTMSLKQFVVVDESQKAKNDTSTSAMLGGKLSAILYPGIYKDLHPDIIKGTNDRILFLSATPFDQYKHVYSYFRLLGFSPYVRMATFEKKGRDSIPYPDGFFEVKKNIINFIERCSEIFPSDFMIPWVTSVHNDNIFSDDLNLSDTRMVPLHNIDLIPKIESLFSNYTTQKAYRVLFRIYVGYLKHVLSSYVPKPAMRGQKRYLANLFIDVDYNSASAAIFEAYLYSTLRSRVERNGIKRVNAMAESQTFRRNVSRIKAHSVGTLARQILDNTINDKVLIFVSEDYPQNWIMNYINFGGVDKRGRKYEDLNWAAEIRGGGKYVDINGRERIHYKENDTKHINLFQEDSNELRCIVAKLSMASVGISLHDLHGTHPRHTFIIPDSDLTNVTQSIGRTIRVGMKSSAAVYIVYTGSCREGEAPEEEGIDYTPQNFIEVNRVYSNLYKKTKIMSLALQGTDMDFPGDFVSIMESDLEGNFYDWSRKELLENEDFTESNIIPDEVIPRGKEHSLQLIADLYTKKEEDRKPEKGEPTAIYYDYDYQLSYGENEREVVPQALINSGAVHSIYYQRNERGKLKNALPDFRLDPDYVPPSPKDREEDSPSSSSSAKSPRKRKPAASPKSPSRKSADVTATSVLKNILRRK